MGDERVVELTRRLREGYDRVLATLDEITDDAAWTAVTVGEGWPVAVVTRHIADGYSMCTHWVSCAVAGTPIGTTMDWIHAQNDDVVARYGTTTREESLAALAASWAELETLLSGLQDEDLRRAVRFPVAGEEAEADSEFYIKNTIRHTAGHLQSLRAAAGLETAAT